MDSIITIVLSISDFPSKKNKKIDTYCIEITLYNVNLTRRYGANIIKGFLVANIASGNDLLYFSRNLHNIAFIKFLILESSSFQ